jgi:TRAP-type C4-dicarboxylate transport system permease small subunit
MNALKCLSRMNAALSGALKVLLVVVFLILVVDVIWGVGSRYLFGTQTSWSEELARLLMVWLALLGAALAARENRHLGLDVLVRSWPDDIRRLATLFITLLTILFAGWIMAWGGIELVEQRFASGQTLPALGISRGWFYLALPVSGILTTCFMVELFWVTLVGTSVEKEEHA